MGVKIKPKLKEGEKERLIGTMELPEGGYGLHTPGKDAYSSSTPNLPPEGTRYDVVKDASVKPAEYSGAQKRMEKMTKPFFHTNVDKIGGLNKNGKPNGDGPDQGPWDEDIHDLPQNVEITEEELPSYPIETLSPRQKRKFKRKSKRLVKSAWKGGAMGGIMG